MSKPFIVLLHFNNGCVNEAAQFNSYCEALNYCQHNVSLTGRVRRIEVAEGASVYAMWDTSWNDESKATLFNTAH